MHLIRTVEGVTGETISYDMERGSLKTLRAGITIMLNKQSQEENVMAHCHEYENGNVELTNSIENESITFHEEAGLMIVSGQGYFTINYLQAESIARKLLAYAEQKRKE